MDKNVPLVVAEVNPDDLKSHKNIIANPNCSTIQLMLPLKPLHEKYKVKKLGFKKPTDNSIDSVSDRDFAIDFLYSSAVCAMHLSRLAEDFIIFNSDAFNLINFNDSMLTGSSIRKRDTCI